MGQPYETRVVTTVGWIECRLVEAMYAHGAAALKDFADTCRHRSGISFASGDEQKARWLRNLATDLDKLAEDKRIQQRQAATETAKWGAPVSAGFTCHDDTPLQLEGQTANG